MGARSLKPGRTRFFVGYKKHTLRLWWRAYPSAVLLVPLISWAAPAHVPEGYLLRPSIQQCVGRFGWRPDIVVGDLGYIHGPTKAQIRQRWNVAIVTKIKKDMTLIDPFDCWNQMSCPHGAPLHWLGYDPAQEEHWFGVSQPSDLCQRCWDYTNCAKEFAFRADLHETLLGLIPLNTVVARRLLQQVRSWIEATQSFDKNQLGLKTMFFNSLRLTWCISLLSDAVALLRAMALLRPVEPSHPLEKLMPEQLNLGLEDTPRD